MPHSFGVRARTRDLFSQPFRHNGTIPTTTLLATFRRGDYVDIKANASIQKGLPHKFYHGKTGRVFNITAHGIGVVVNKQVRNRIVQKKLLLRAEHLKKSQCREDFLNRVKQNEVQKAEGQFKGLKRQPVGPNEGHFVVVNSTKVVDKSPLPFQENY